MSPSSRLYIRILNDSRVIILKTVSSFTPTETISMKSPSSCLRVTRLALIHAVIAYISPEFTEVSRIPLPLPTEIRLRILTYLHLTLSVSLLERLRDNFQNAIDELCDGCRAYNFHVYGENVSEWPEIKVTGGCSCAQIGPQSWPETPHNNQQYSEPCVHVKFRSPIADSDPPPYFIFHLRHIAVTYLSTFPASAYMRDLEPLITPRAGAKEINALVSSVLRNFHCCIPPSKSGAWNLEDELCIVPISDHHTSGHDEILSSLQLALELGSHRDFISESTLHPRNIKFTPPLIIHPGSGSKCAVSLPIGYHADQCLDCIHSLSNPTSANTHFIWGIGLACVIFSIRCLAPWS